MISISLWCLYLRSTGLDFLCGSVSLLFGHSARKANSPPSEGHSIFSGGEGMFIVTSDCTVYGGAPHMRLPVPISITQSGYPRIIPFFHRRMMA